MKENEMVWACCTNVEEENEEDNEECIRILVGKPEGKRPLGRPRRRLVDIIRDRIGWNGLDRSGSG
jgi:hypothetical protein